MQWEKAIGQLRLNLNTIMHPLRSYGQGYYVDAATEEIISLAVQLYEKLSGVDRPYHLNHDKLRY